MKNKQLTYSEDARAQLKSGVDKLAKAVKVTLGAKGRTVGFTGGDGLPHPTKDGVTVAKQVYLSHPVEDMGAQMVKEAAAKTAYETGDSTTTSTVLAQSMVERGFDYINQGANPMDIKRGMEKAVSEIAQRIKEEATPVSTTDQIRNVATISANNDIELGTLIADTVDEVGKDGTVALDYSNTSETHVKITEGYQFDMGYITPQFVNNTRNLTAEYENPVIWLTDKKILAIEELRNVITYCAENGSPLLIVSEGIEGQALPAIVVNTLQGKVQIVGVNLPPVGAGDVAEDLAAGTGATLISDNLGMKLEDTKPSHLGRADRVIVTANSTSIIGGKGKGINSRIEDVQTQLGKEENRSKQDILRKRISRLKGKAATLYIGAATEVERKEKKDRIDDALASTRSAIEEGVVAGGGLTMFKLSEETSTTDKDLFKGKDVVYNSLLSPINSILENAGVSVVDILSEISKNGFSKLYDVKEDKFVDVEGTTILDSAKSIRVALENAASVSSMILTTECVITNN